MVFDHTCYLLQWRESSELIKAYRSNITSGIADKHIYPLFHSISQCKMSSNFWQLSSTLTLVNQNFVFFNEKLSCDISGNPLP